MKLDLCSAEFDEDANRSRVSSQWQRQEIGGSHIPRVTSGKGGDEASPCASGACRGRDSFDVARPKPDLQHRFQPRWPFKIQAVFSQDFSWPSKPISKLCSDHHRIIEYEFISGSLEGLSPRVTKEYHTDSRRLQKPGPDAFEGKFRL